MIRHPDHDAEPLIGGRIPRRVGDHVIPTSEVVAQAPGAHRGELITPAGFLAHLPNRAPARACGLERRAPAPHRRSLP